jgi:hypothetical protein
MEPRNRAVSSQQDPAWQVVDDRPKKGGSSIWSKMTGWLDKVDQKLTGGPASNGKNGKFDVD